LEPKILEFEVINQELGVFFELKSQCLCGRKKFGISSERKCIFL